MRTGLNIKLALTVLACITFGTGCRSIGAYFKDRGLDFADTFVVKAGYGGPASAGVSLFGVGYASAGISASRKYGFIGRDYVEEDRVVFGVPVVNLVAPVVFIGSALHFKPLPAAVSLSALLSSGVDVSQVKKGERDTYHDFNNIGFAGVNLKPILMRSREGFKVAKIPPHRYYDFRAFVCAGVAIEIGFSAVELADFILGWFSVDFLGDDTGNDKEGP